MNFFIHLISFSELLHAKENMIRGAQEEFWSAIRHDRYILLGIQKAEWEYFHGHSWVVVGE